MSIFATIITLFFEADFLDISLQYLFKIYD